MSFRLESVDQLFPAPVLRFDLADAAALNRLLLREIAGRRASESGIARTNVGGWHSERDFFLRREPAHERLAAELRHILQEATRLFDPNVDFGRAGLVLDGWINVNPPGAVNAPHMHRGWFWSGCYYVDVDANSGGIEFLNPFEALPGDGLVGGPLVAERARFDPAPGLALIFPATMAHWVYPNRSTRDRVSIAFNAKFAARR